MIARIWRWWRRTQAEDRRRMELLGEAYELYGYPAMQRDLMLWHSLSIPEQELVLMLRRLRLEETTAVRARLGLTAE